MTPEELLRPRYLMIAPYPSNEWKVGDIIETIVGKDGELVARIYNEVFTPDGSEDQGVIEYGLDFFDEYPHLFRLLEWWEERKPEDMPAYVKDLGHKKYDKVVSYDMYGEQMRMVVGGHSWLVIARVMCFFEPATEVEYLKSKTRGIN